MPLPLTGLGPLQFQQYLISWKTLRLSLLYFRKQLQRTTHKPSSTDMSLPGIRHEPKINIAEPTNFRKQTRDLGTPGHHPFIPRGRAGKKTTTPLTAMRLRSQQQGTTADTWFAVADSDPSISFDESETYRPR